MQTLFMRIFFYCFFLFLLTIGHSPLHAQLPDGTIAPDFTVTDLNGTTHNLYEKLDAGKIVILDIFATWCGPCWSYSEKNSLEKIWQKYGPLGTDEVFIFYIESDPGTTIEDIEGTGNYTFGDYTANINFPIFSTSSINTLYNQINYPTVYMICPNKRTTEIGQITLSEAADLFDNSCSVPTGVDNGELLFLESNLIPFCKDEYYTPAFRFQNVGTNDILNARFDLSINGQIIEEDFLWEGFIQPFETTKINFPSINLFADQDKNINVLLKKVNEELDSTPLNNSVFGKKPSPKAFTEKINVEIKTDAFGYEVYWEIRNKNGVAIAKGGNDLVEPGQSKPPNVLQGNPNGYYHSDTLYTHQVELPYMGCYEFYIIDDYKDGVCCKYGDGFFRLKDQNGKVVLEGGESFSILYQDFERTTSLVATNEVTNTSSVNIFPNPASTFLNVQIQKTQQGKGNISIYNNLGQLVSPPSTFLHSQKTSLQTIDPSTLTPGIYLLRLQLDNEFSTHKFVVEYKGV